MKFNLDKKLLALVLVGLFGLVISLAYASAVDPGHSAPSIGSGTFESGNYVFPNNFTVGTNIALFANNASGRVGIGTTSPSSLLNVVIPADNNTGLLISADGNSSDTILGNYIQIKNINADASSRISSLAFNEISGQFVLRAIGNGQTFRIGEGTTSITDYLTIGGAGSSRQGSVGIGTTSPTHTLNVVGGANITTNLTAANNLFVNSSSVGIGTLTPSSVLEINSASPKLKLTDSGAQDWSIRSQTNNFYIRDESNGYDIATFYAGSGVDIFKSSTNAAFTITNTIGAVGINTSSPGAMLHIVQRYDNASGGFRIQRASDPAAVSLYVTSGLGSLQDPLVFSSTSGSGGDNFAVDRDGLTYIRNRTGIGTNTPNYFLDVRGNASINSTLYVNANGNVGIGTTAPTHTLNVLGTANITGITYHHANISLGGFRITNLSNPILADDAATKAYADSINTSSSAADDWNLSSSNLFPKDLAYNIGIGTATPTAKLDVNGSSRLTTLSQGYSSTERFYPNVISGVVDDFVNGSWIIDTPIPRDSNAMFAIRVHGYAYGAQDVIDFTIVGYAYNGLNGSLDNVPGRIINYDISDRGTDKYNKYVGAGNITKNVSIAFGDSSTLNSYFYRLSVDAWVTSGGATTDYSLGWKISRNSTNSTFGWGDFNGPLQGDVYVRGNLGVGTTSPSNTAHINGTFRVANTTGSGGLFQDANANVGIGTTNPDHTLEVNGYAQINSGLIGDSANGFLKLYPDYESNAYLEINDTGRFIFSGGNLSIGTTASTHTLNVVGNANITLNTTIGNALFVNANNGRVGIGTTSPARALDINSNGAARFASAGNGFEILESGSTNWQFTPIGTVTSLSLISDVGIGTTTPTHKLNVLGTANITQNTTIGNALFVNANNGRVGIGTASPSTLLHLSATAPTLTLRTSANNNTAKLSFVSNNSAERGYIQSTMDEGVTNTLSLFSRNAITFVNNAAESMRIDENGNVGIGTASPTRLLDVRGIANFSSEIYVQNNSPVSIWLYNHTSAANTSIFTTYDSRWSTTFNASYDNINTTLNIQHLINGSVINGIWNASGTNVFLGNLGYNVGIGTATPTAKLDVIGNVNISGNIQVETSSNDGDIIFTDGTSYGIGNSSDFISASAGLKGRLVNYNPDFSQGTWEYTVYDNNDTAPDVIFHKVISDNSSGSASGKVLNISYNGSGTPDVNPTPGYGGFYIAVSRCTNQASSDCYIEGNRYVYKIIAKIPSGRTLVWTTNNYGSGGTQRWISSQAGTGKWEQYIMTQKIGYGGSLSSTGFWYITGGSNAAFEWYVASVEMIGIDEPATVEQTKSLNIGYKQNVNLTSGNLLSTTSTYLATDSGNVGIGTTSPTHTLNVVGGANITTNLTVGNNLFANQTRVGIGIANPAAKLEVDDATASGTALQVYQRSSSGTNYGVVAQSNGAGSTMVGGQFDALGGTSNIAIQTTTDTAAGADNYAIRSLSTAKSYFAGNVGLGTTSPNYALEINNNTKGLNVSNFLFVNASGVGIGTTSPTHTLNVAGNANITQNTTIGNALFVNANNGRVGIGTTNQNYTLEVIGTVRASTQFSGQYATLVEGGAGAQTIISMNSAGTYYGTIQQEALANGGTWSLGYQASANHTVGTPVLTWNGNGNVGVGIASPDAKLQVNGSYIKITNGSSTVLNEVLRFGRIPDDARYNSIFSYSDDSGNARIDFAVHNGSTGTSQQTVLSLKGNGNAGIGTTSPTHTLNVVGGANITGNTTLGTSFLFNANTGNLGIGAADSGYKFLVNGDIRMSNNLYFTNPLSFTDGASGTYGIRSGVNTGLELLSNSSTARITILPTGNVGIGAGATAPAKLLDIDGQFQIDNDGQAFWGSTANNGVLSWDTNLAIVGGQANSNLSLRANNAEKVRINTDGNVGIGTTSPSAKLDVKGAIVTNDTLFQAGYGTSDGLILYLPFSEGSGTTTYDSAKYGTDGTLTCAGGSCSNPKWTAGKMGNALNFTSDGGTSGGNASYVSVPTSSALSNSKSLTWEAWIYPTAVSTDQMFLGSSSASDNYFRISSSALFFSMNNGTQQTLAGSTALTNNKWHHVAATYDNSTFEMKIYLNGVLDASQTLSGGNSNPGSGGQLFVGIFTTSDTRGFAGKMDEVKIYNRALSPEEIRLQYLRTGAGNAVITDVFRLINTTNSVYLFANGSSGKVGIGTSSPSELLNVNGTGAVAAKIQTASTSGTRDAIVKLYVPNEGGNDPAGSIYFNALSSETNIARISGLTNSNGNGGQILFYTHSGASLIERMRIKTDGYVGIGTTAPTAALEVNGSINLTGTANREIRVGDSSTDGYNLTVSGGNQGAAATKAGDLVLKGGGITGTDGYGGRVYVYGGLGDFGAGDLILAHTGSVAQGKVGIATTGPQALLHVQNGAVIFNGTTGATPTSGAGTRFMWIPAKSALRAGYVSGTQWDDANIGYYSTAFGNDATASGYYSAAFGYTTIASGNNSIAFGEDTLASEYDSFVSGVSSAVSGQRSIAMGRWINVSGNSSIAFGRGTGFSNRLNNSINDSFMVGFGSTPTLFVNGSSVGIGTTTPTAKLEVNGGITLTGAQTIQTSTGALRLDTGSAASLDLYTFGTLRWSILGSDSNKILQSSGDGIIQTSSGALTIQPSGNTTFATTNGNVGIGTTSPAFPLTVVTNANNTANNVTLWVSGNVSATGYITRTYVWDSSKMGSALAALRNSSELVMANGEVNHSAFGNAYVKYGNTRIKNKKAAGENENAGGKKADQGSITGNAVNDGEGNNTNALPEETETFEEEGVLLDAQVAKHEQALYELYQEMLKLKAELNNTVKGNGTGASSGNRIREVNGSVVITLG